MKKICLVLLLALSSVNVFSSENITYYGEYSAATNADSLITTEGQGIANTKFSVNKRQVNIFQDCAVLQYTGFIKIGACGAYKAGSQLWARSATTLINNSTSNLIVYPTTTPASTVYATANMTPFIVGALPVYTWQDCTQADTVNYALIGTCSTGLALWKRITPLQ